MLQTQKARWTIIHSYGNRFGDIDDAEDAVTSITDEADY